MVIGIIWGGELELHITESKGGMGMKLVIMEIAEWTNGGF